MNIGDRIKKLRERQGLTQEEVGKHLGVDKATVNRYEKGNIDIKRKTALLLSEIFQVTPAYIMGWESGIYDSSRLEADERRLLSDYRSLTRQGKEFICQAMVATLSAYRKNVELAPPERASVNLYRTSCSTDDREPEIFEDIDGFIECFESAPRVTSTDELLSE